jgi:uncharacterized protein (TIGR03435 family)
MNNRFALKLNCAGRLLLLAAASLALAIPSAFAQTAAPPAAAPAETADQAAKPITFEVATIKPSNKPGKFPWGEQPTPDGETWENVPLQQLLRDAYGIYDDNLWAGGPAWLDTQRFDVVAKFDVTETPHPTLDQRKVALQELLADRFKVKIHHETKESPVYDLVIAKGGPKFQQSPPEHLIEKGVLGGTCLLAKGYQGCGIDSLLLALTYASGRTVIDKTGLKGLYDYPRPVYSTVNTPATSPAADYPSIFTAVQEQLGLKLEPSTAPLDILVIDSAEPPTPN